MSDCGIYVDVDDASDVDSMLLVTMMLPKNDNLDLDDLALMYV